MCRYSQFEQMHFPSFNKRLHKDTVQSNTQKACEERGEHPLYRTELMVAIELGSFLFLVPISALAAKLDCCDNNQRQQNIRPMVETAEQELSNNRIPPGPASLIHKLTVIVHGSGISEKDLVEPMIGSDLKAKVAVPHSNLYAFDMYTNSQIDVGDLDLVTNKCGANLRLVESNTGNVREIYPIFLII
jgi:hypothetical protein